VGRTITAKNTCMENRRNRRLLGKAREAQYGPSHTALPEASQGLLHLIHHPFTANLVSPSVGKLLPLTAAR